MRSEHAVMWRGKRSTPPAGSEFPLDAMEAEEEGGHLAALRLILGQAQYATWRNRAKTAADVEDFSVAVMRELGQKFTDNTHPAGRTWPATARVCGTDAAFPVICAQDIPDHTTIARFR